MRVFQAPEDIQEMVRQRPDSLTHAREIVGIKDPQLRAEAIKQTVEQKASLAAIRELRDSHTKQK